MPYRLEGLGHRDEVEEYVVADEVAILGRLGGRPPNRTPPYTTPEPVELRSSALRAAAHRLDKSTFEPEGTPLRSSAVSRERPPRPHPHVDLASAQGVATLGRPGGRPPHAGYPQSQ